MKTNLLLSLLLAAFFATPARAHEGHDHDHANDHAGAAHQHDGEECSHDHAAAGGAAAVTTAPLAPPIVLDAQQAKNIRLQLAEVTKDDFEQTLFSLGRVAVFPGNRAVVSSRVAGRAVSVSVKPDQRVRAGDTVLVIESRQPGEPPPRITLTAPADGLVASVSIAPGQPLTPDDSLAEIVDLSEVHALARVPEHFSGKLQVGQKAFIRVPGFPDTVFDATLQHIGVAADAQSGTLEAAFHVPNPENLLRPGMRAAFSIVTEKRAGVVSIPREAVQGDAAGRFVYVAAHGLDTAFVKTPVTLGEQNDTRVEILQGVAPGQKVVTRGAYALGFVGTGAVSLKAALDAAHGHAHAEDGSELPKEKTPQATTPVGASLAKPASAETPPSPVHGHSHEDHDHDHDHAGESGPARATALTWFFATLSGLLAVLLALSVFFRKSTPNT